MEAIILPIDIFDNDDSITRAKKLFDRMKQALGDIKNVSLYMSGYDKESIRTLKISDFPGGGSYLKYRPVPFIRIAGRWVEKAGFQVGESVQVVTIKDMILIVPAQGPGKEVDE